MKRVFVSVFFVLVAMIVNAQDIAGHWGGTLNIQGVKLRLVFHVSRSGDSWTTTMDSPDQGAKGIPTGKTEYADSVLTITAPALGMKFSGKWQGTDRIQGTFVQGGLTLPLEMRGERKSLPRPQENTYPYRVEEVTWRKAAGGYALRKRALLPGCRVISVAGRKTG
ncbi:MAG: hypothetical protein ACLU4N_13100 [Butyricimonas faecihominis]